MPITATPTPADATSCFLGDDSKGTLCRWIYDRTDNEWLARSSDWLVARPVHVLIIVIIALILRRLVHRTIEKAANRLAEGVPHPGLGRGRSENGRPGPADNGGTLATERRHQRAATMSSVLRSVSTGVIFTVAALMSCAEVGLNVAPLIASAGIIGVALGFGAQSLVKDFLSGLFMIIEDQYGVGDVTDLGDASGTVEAVGLRVTRLRDVNGTVWYMRNGEIARVGNKSQGWARAVVDVDIAYGEDVARVRHLMLDTANKLFEDEANAALIIEPPEVWGVEALSADAVVVRLVVKTVPLQQWKVSRMLREQVKVAFDEAGVEIPFPQRTVWVRTEGSGQEDTAEAVTAGTGVSADR